MQPSKATAGVAFSPAVEVTIEDQSGNQLTNATDSVTLVIGANPGGGTLSGATVVRATSGVATFTGIAIDRPASGYTLVATGGLAGATSAPFDVVARPVVTFAAVSGGQGYACGVMTSGAAYCWGYNADGELGDGTSSGPQQCAVGVQSYACSLTPVAVSGGLTFSTVSAGRYHACGVTLTGAAYCWGSNVFGQLGNGTTTNSTTPVPVSGGLAFAAVSAGGAWSCGITAAGAAYCWGDNSHGELGNGAATGSATPVVVSGGLTFASVSAGGNATCGVTIAATAYCWGDNVYGDLGNPSSGIATTPVPVSGSLTFATVSAGQGYACGVTGPGASYCWGLNDVGELGNGTQTNSGTPVAVSGGLIFASVSAGGPQTCGITTGGAAYCWGSNGAGELGTGTTTGPQTCPRPPNPSVPCSTTPVAVSGRLTFAALSSGFGHTCGLTAAGTAYCWGANDYGQLGNGSTVASSVPVRVVQ